MKTLSNFCSTATCIQATLILCSQSAPSSDAQAPKERAILRGHPHQVTSAAFSPNGKIVAAGSRDGTVQLWDVANASRIRRLEGDRVPREPVEAVLFSPDGKTVAAGVSHGTMILWEVATGHVRAKTENVRVTLKSPMAFSPDGQTLAVGGGNGIWFWDLVGNQARRAAVPSHYRGTSTTFAFAYTPQGKPLYTNVAEESLELWDGASGKHITTLRKPWIGQGRLVLSADTQLLAAARLDQVSLFDLTTNKQVASYSLGPKAPSSISCMSFSPDAKVLAIGHICSFEKIGAITLIEVATGKNFASWVAYGDRQQIGEMGLRFSPDGRTLASYRHIVAVRGGVDDTLKLWDVPPASKKRGN